MLKIEEIENILNDHYIKYSRDHHVFIIDSFEDGIHFEKLDYKSLNSIAKIKNWLGY